MPPLIRWALWEKKGSNQEAGQEGASGLYKGGFVANRGNGKLETILCEAFAAIEHQFASMDKDGAGVMMFKMLETQLGMHGFYDRDSLQDLWDQVDVQKKGYLDFAEFLCLLFLWSAVGDYTHFFERSENCKMVAEAFQAMEHNWQRYDEDNSRRFNYDELVAFFHEQLPELYPGCLSHIDTLYPETQRERADTLRELVDVVRSDVLGPLQKGHELSFPRFMHMLYVCCCDMSLSRIPGNYAKLGIAKQEMKLLQEKEYKEQLVGPQSATWIFLERAFKVLEADFARFDASGDGFIDYVELTMALPALDGLQRLNIMARLEFKFKQVDLDKTNSVDFYEFIYLGFLMTQDGSYHDLVEKSDGHEHVKKAFVELLSWYQESDSSGMNRLVFDDVRKFCDRHFHMIPETLQDVYNQFSYVSSNAGGQKVIDIIRFMKLLVTIILPESKFHPSRYKPFKKSKSSAASRLISVKEKEEAGRPPRIDPVVPSRFVRNRKLGSGGQGSVFGGTYDGLVCAGKVMLGTEINKKRLGELIREAQLLSQLNHPNCHYYIGAKLTEADGGPLVLTELCDEGSLFDLYARKQRKLAAHTSWRLARECALGYNYVHELGFMHRDIKSLNVFLTSNFVARVADFGMATPKKTATDACGTVQWMAPEVLANFREPGKSTYDRRCDIYSFGILLWEIYHCRCPYAQMGLDQMQIAFQVLINGIRPAMDEYINEDAQELIEMCWSQDPAARPSWAEIIEILDTHLKP